MNQLDIVSDWGSELNDLQFSNAFAALGILTAFTTKDRNNPKNIEKIPFPANSENGPYDAIKNLIQHSANTFHKKDFKLAWRFPNIQNPMPIGKQIIPLSSLKPKVMASVGEQIINDFRPRLSIKGFPTVEPIRPWFRLLCEAIGRVEKGVYIELPHIRQVPYMKWPLRFGYFSGNEVDDILKNIEREPLFSEFGRSVSINRSEANCDILLYSGSSRVLLKELLNTKIPIKNNLILVKGSFEDDPAATISHLTSMVNECRANGILFLKSDFTQQMYRGALLGLIYHLSHNEPVDCALLNAFSIEQKADPVFLLSSNLADFKIDRVLEKMCARLENLKDLSTIKINSNTLAEAGLPSHIGGKDIRSMVKAAVSEKREFVDYSREIRGARVLAALDSSLDETERNETSQTKTQRFLTEQIFVKRGEKYVEEKRGFIAGKPTKINICIGPLKKGKQQLTAPFPEGERPKNLDYWQLTIVLTEPHHLKKPLMGSIRLPKTGPSTTCSFKFIPVNIPRFEGRITVLHRGRVLQTGIIYGNVFDRYDKISINTRIKLKDNLHIRTRIGDLGYRRQYDVAFVQNRSSDNRPRLTSISTNNAWLQDISAFQGVAKDVNDLLGRATRFKDNEIINLLTSQNRDLLYNLALTGSDLYGEIVEDRLEPTAKNIDISTSEYIQIVTTKEERLIPFEFIYDYIAPSKPDDSIKGVPLCPKWEEALKNITNSQTSCWDRCAKDDPSILCPLGFWGVRKVIERHSFTPELHEGDKDIFLQSEDSEITAKRTALSLKGNVLVGASGKIDQNDLDNLLSICKDSFATEPIHVNQWDEWEKRVGEFSPKILLALPHTEEKGRTANLEIGGSTINSVQIRETHLHPKDTVYYPLVALFGCDTTGTMLEYGKPISAFRRRGAAIVIGTSTSILNKHAAKLAELFVEVLSRNKEIRLGEIIRSVKCQALLKGLVMPLCIVAYGDADWILS